MKTALIGSGNSFFKDEGVGLYAVKYIKENYELDDELSIVDGGTLGFKLMPLLLEFESVIIVNTSSDESLEAGSIIIKDADEFIDGSRIKKTANEVEIAEMLQICSLSEKMADVSVISIVPQDIISVEVGLSQAIHERFESFIIQIVNLLHIKGIKAEKKGAEFTLADILYTFANPSIEEARGF
jgi:hydrogenase maturation protease